ncbi:hypothetical protein Ndes2526A_g08052 [Nannochloris sp. 'desiccata']
MLGPKKGKGLKLGGTAQAPGGGALLKPGGASLPSRPLGGGAQGPGLPRGSLKSSAATEKEDDGFDADDWFKDYEIDPEDVDDDQSPSQSAAKQASCPNLLQSDQDNNEDEIIDIMNKVPPRAVEHQQPPFGSLETSAADNKELGAKESPSSEGQQQKLGEESAAADEQMECEVSSEEKVEEEENGTVDIINSKTADATEAALNDAQRKQLSSDDDLGSLFGEEDDNEEDEVMIETPPSEKATAAAATPLPAPNPSPPKELSSFQFPTLTSAKHLPNNNRPRVPSRLGPGRSPPLPAAATAPPTAPVHAAKAAINNINERISPLFPSATTKSPALASELLAGNKQLAAAGGGDVTGTPTPITPAGGIQARSGAAITPGTATPFLTATTVEKAAPAAAKAAAAATPQTAAAASPAAPPPPPPAPPSSAAALDIDDALLEIDFSVRGDKFLSSLEDEEAATQEALATPTAKKVFSLSTSVAAAGVETESLSKKLEELEVNLTMTRLRYALDTVEATVMGAILLGSGVGKENTSGESSAAAAAAAAGGVVNEEEAMEIDIMD